MKPAVLMAVASLVVATPDQVFGQSSTGWASLEVRQNVDVKSQVAKPAIVQIVDPTDDGRDVTALVNIGALWALLSTDKATLSGAVAWSKNTTLKKVQDAWQAGLIIDGKLSSEGFAPVLQGGAALQEDRVAKASAFKTQVLATATGDNRTGLPNTTVVLGSGSTLVYNPMVGVEHEHTLPDRFTDRTYWRGVARFDVTLRFGEPTEPTVEFTALNAWRNDWADRSNASTQSTDCHSYTLSLFPYKSTRGLAGITAGYVWGEDPGDKFESKGELQFGLSLRVKAAEDPSARMNAP